MCQIWHDGLRRVKYVIHNKKLNKLTDIYQNSIITFNIHSIGSTNISKRVVNFKDIIKIFIKTKT